MGGIVSTMLILNKYKVYILRMHRRIEFGL